MILKVYVTVNNEVLYNVMIGAFESTLALYSSGLKLFCINSRKQEYIIRVPSFKSSVFIPIIIGCARGVVGLSYNLFLLIDNEEKHGDG